MSHTHRGIGITEASQSLLDVTMDDVVLVQVLQAFADLDEVLPYHLLHFHISFFNRGRDLIFPARDNAEKVQQNECFEQI